MADPHLRPGRPLRDRRAGAQSHVRGYRSSCGPHLASSGVTAGGSLGVARAGLPVRMGSGAPPSPGLGPAISRDAGGPSRAGVAARRIVQSLRRGPSPDAPRLPVARRPLPIAQATRATSAAGAAASCASLPTWGGMRAISAAVAVLASRGIRPRETSSPRRPRSLPEQARACPGIARDTGVPPLLRHAGLPRARTQAPSTRGLRTSARPPPGTRPGPRPSAPGPPEGARPRWDAALRPDEGRERPPASAEGASAGGRPRAPRAHGRVDGRPPARRGRPRPTRRPRGPRCFGSIRTAQKSH